jgi:hypothetical protein
MMKQLTLLDRALFLMVLVIIAGCGDAPDLRDQRLAEFARDTMQEQRLQNERMADQSGAVVEESRQLAETAKLLVEHDAQSRREIIAVQTELTSQLNQRQAVVDAGRDQLEQDRQQIAERRYWDPIIALTLESTGLAIACLLPLVICFFVIRQMHNQEPDHAAVAELLIQELTDDQPLLLRGMFPEPTRLEHQHHHRLPEVSSTEDKLIEDHERPF